MKKKVTKVGKIKASSKKKSIEQITSSAYEIAGKLMEKIAKGKTGLFRKSK